MGEVVHLDDFRPHMMATHPDGGLHVAPVQLVRELALCKGEISGFDAELAKAIMWSWLIDNGHGE